MSHTEAAAYGLWGLAAINIAFFLFFAVSFVKPKTSRDWRTLGPYTAFLVALFAEMYGFPLTIYLLSGWLQSRFPDVDWLAHDSGHLLEMMLGWRVNPHFGPFHVLSYVLIGGGFMLIARAWTELHRAQTQYQLATSGPYAFVRHPQYAGFLMVMTGFLFQWPTLITLAMYPVLVFAYVRLARREEAEARLQFGADYLAYERAVPRWLPRPARLREALRP